MKVLWHFNLPDALLVGLATKNVGLDQCTEEEFKEFGKLNDSYKKFGFPFILAVKGKTKIEILNNFKKRISSDPETEFDEAIKQVKLIASLR